MQPAVAGAALGLLALSCSPAVRAPAATAKHQVHAEPNERRSVLGVSMVVPTSWALDQIEGVAVLAPRGPKDGRVFVVAKDDSAAVDVARKYGAVDEPSAASAAAGLQAPAPLQKLGEGKGRQGGSAIEYAVFAATTSFGTMRLLVLYDTSITAESRAELARLLSSVEVEPPRAETPGPQRDLAGRPLEQPKKEPDEVMPEDEPAGEPELPEQP